ncbi:MAG: hypothetical protein M1819_003880 [Sarea resinae]|nr:MAG: hypothetical protein M1819_003880 [Sarea resinae]
MASPTAAPPPPSAFSALAESSSTDNPTTQAAQVHPAHLQTLALQVQHNLQHQHDWTALTFHTHSPLSPTTPLPRPILSGLPPQRLYIHPDEQIEMLKAGMREADAPLQREWVLPTHLKEKWSLRRFADVFDLLGAVPAGVGSEEEGEGVGGVSDDSRTTTKRLLLATVDDDSTVVYYIVHDGIVKPRQN